MCLKRAAPQCKSNRLDLSDSAAETRLHLNTFISYSTSNIKFIFQKCQSYSPFGFNHAAFPSSGLWGVSDTRAQQEMMLHNSLFLTPGTSTRAQQSDLSLALKLSHKIPPCWIYCLSSEGDSSARSGFCLGAAATRLSPPGIPGQG